MGIATSTAIVSAQSATGSFNPQTQLQTGSTIVIRSVYGIATPRPQGGTGQPHNWNQSQQNLPSYNTSITIDIQITGETSDGGIQFIIQGGVIVVGTSTIVITGGNGEMSSIDRMMMEGTATSTNSQSLNWRMSGLAALLNGALISELTGNAPIIVNGIQTNVIFTCIATIS